MSIRHTPLTDDQIEALLLARSSGADRSLVEDILAATDQLPQRRSGWLARPLDRRMLSLFTAALLLAALAGALALAARYLPPDLDLDPPPGPEGGWILYIDANGDPVLSDLAGGVPQPIERPRGPMRCPAFSPEGRLLAFTEERRSGDSGQYDLVVAALNDDGALETRLLIEGSGLPCPKWFRDGRLASGAEVLTLDPECRVGPSCDASSTVRVRFPRPIEEHVAWRYDGSELLVLTQDGVLAGQLDGGPARTVYEMAPDDRRFDFGTGFVASPAGPYVAIAGNSMSNEGTIMVIDMEGDVIFEQTRNYHLETGTVAWSPDGSRLAWPDPDGIRMLSIDRPGETTLLRLPPIPRPGWGAVEDAGVSGLAWSPDGRRLLLNVAHGLESEHAHAFVSVPVAGSADVVLHSEWGGFEVWNGMSWQSR